MKKVIKYIVILVVFFGIESCTSNFEEYNTNPYGVSDESLEQDFMNIGGYFAQLQQFIYDCMSAGDFEGIENLAADPFAQYLVPPNPFNSNRNNMTYSLVNDWYKQQWEYTYDIVMSVIYRYDQDNVKQDYPNFYAWATVLKIFSVQRLTDNYGPAIYSEYGSTASTINYDSQKDIYYSFFDELDEAVDALTTYADEGSEAFSDYDLVYGGDVSKWVKAANSLRLRLAMRISNIDPGKAQEEAEKAVSQSYGVFEDNDDNFFVDLGSNVHPLYTVSVGWNASCMCATMESILGGYNDPRLPVYFSEATDEDLPDGSYKGIRQGVDISSKSTYASFSVLGSMYETIDHVQIMTAAEVTFLRAEGALRGWNMGGTAEDFYNDGIQLSFEQYGLSSYAAYMNDDTHTFADYVDPKNSANDFDASSDVTIKWNDSDSKERSLERIITQKWIACFPDGQEAWSEFRRTGYPKLIPVVVNYSGGTISTEEFIRRLPYPDSEYSSNADGVAGGITLLGGADTGGTRIWWDTGGSNF